jgi:hypothetical protein
MFMKITTRVAAALLISVLLTGCGYWSSTIKSQSANFANVVEETSDSLVLINILEARDKAPLHFTEFPKVTNALQATASLQSAIPFAEERIGGALANSVVAGTVTPNLTVQSAPTFEVDNLDTKEFVTGMSSPIDPKYVKYWMDRGLDNRLLIFLFVSSIQIEAKHYLPYDAKPGDKPIDAVITVKNFPRATADLIKPCTDSSATNCHLRTDFEFFLRIVNAMDTNDITANAYLERKPLGLGVPLYAKDVAKFDSAKYQLEYLSNDKYNVYSVDPAGNIALCFQNLPARQLGAPSSGPAADSSPNPCHVSTITDPTGPAKIPVPPVQISDAGIPPCPIEGSPNSAPTSRYCDLIQKFDLAQTSHVMTDYSIGLTIRSVAEIVRFLGDLLHYQDVLQQDNDLNVPVTLGYNATCHAPLHPSRDCLLRDGGAIFRVNGDDSNARFKVAYREKTYSVGEYSPLDHTLEVFSILNQLIGLNKSATDIRSTPLVQVVP